MKRVIMFALVLLAALGPVAGLARVAEAHWDSACQCNEMEAP